MEKEGSHAYLDCGLSLSFLKIIFGKNIQVIHLHYKTANTDKYGMKIRITLIPLPRTSNCLVYIF